jgi:acetyl esterase/lipase
VSAPLPVDAAAHNAAVMAALFAQRAVEADAAAGHDPERVRVVRDLEFARPGGVPLRADLYLPAEAPPPIPVVLWLHGGGWANGDRRTVPDLERHFARRGYAMASVDYRKSGVARFPAPLEDVRAAIRWLRDVAGEHGLDPEAVGIWGSSAGGHLGALAALTAREPRDAVRCVVAGYAPTDLANLNEGRREDGIAAGGPDSFESLMLGGPPAEVDPEVLRAANPVDQVTAAAPPFLLMHGTDDPIVPHRQSERFYQALAGAGAEATLYLLEGASHAFFAADELDRRPLPPVTVRTTAGGEDRAVDAAAPPTVELVERFFDRHLRADPWR